MILVRFPNDYKKSLDVFEKTLDDFIKRLDQNGFSDYNNINFMVRRLTWQ
jgi:hypothetical protein